jgi:hypothetical protein
VPFRQTTELDMAGVLSTDIDVSYLTAEGKYAFDASGLARLTGLHFGNLATGDARLTIDKSGFDLVGTLDGGGTLISGVTLDESAQIEVKVGDAPQDFVIDVTANMTVGGTKLAAGHVHIDANGAMLEGHLDSGPVQIGMTGSITSTGVNLTGTANVDFEVTGGRTVTQDIVEGTLCGYQTVTDGVLCGYRTVTSGAVCGYNTFTDGATCGYQTVTNGVVCGYNQITSNSCGKDTVTDALQCGTRKGCDSVLGLFGASDLCNDVPATCDVPKTCNDTSSPLSCFDTNQPKTCDNIKDPKTCYDHRLPLSCADHSKPLGCNHQVTTPDFDYGHVTGGVGLTLGTAGLGGHVSGQYCAAGSACAGLSGGSVIFGNPIKVCMDIPGGVGNYCTSI